MHITILLLLLTLPAAAQTGKPPADRSPDALRRAIAAEVERGNAAFGCPGARAGAVTFRDVAPLRLGAASSPLEGARTAHVQIEACNVTRQQNVLIAQGQPPVAVLLLPGLTIADPVLQRDTMLALRPMGSAVLGCPQVSIVDTAVTRFDGNVRLPWTERWMLMGCGRTRPFEVNFVPGAPGTGTTFNFRAI